MFVIASHFNEGEYPVYSCVESIRSIYKTSKIVVVDTGSSTTEYLNGLEKYKVLIEHTGPNYELGAWKKALYKYNEPYYVCIQDAVVLHKPIDSFFKKEFCSYEVCTNGIGTMPGETYKKIYEVLDTYNIPYKNIHLLFGCMFLISNHTRNKLIDTKFFKEFLPKNKLDSCICERVLYSLFEHLGYDVFNSSINNIKYPEKEPYFTKKGFGRQ